MTPKYLLIITFAAVACLVLFKIFWDGSAKEMKSGSGETVMYGESVASTPTPAKFVQINPVTQNDFNHHDITIETLGYREIRVFAQLFADDYKIQPLPKEAALRVGLMHELTGLGVPYGGHSFKQEVASYLQGWVTENIFGKKVKLSVDADNLPKGKYTLQLSYYLLP
jgi:hypothetical protein